MNEDREPSPEDNTFSDDSEVDYKDIVFQQEEQGLPVHLEKKDYVALFVASLETIFLPACYSWANAHRPWPHFLSHVLGNVGW